MSAPSPLMTADELFDVRDDGMRRELVDGVVRVMEPAGIRHGMVEATIAFLLAAHVREHRLGVTLTGDPGFILAEDPDTVRAPDVAFIRQERYDAIDDPSRFWAGTPDLAVEVVSPGDSYSEVQQKAFQWLDAGTLLVLVADPRHRTITAYRGRDDVRFHVEGKSVDAGDAVPGWTLDVGEAFA